MKKQEQNETKQYEKATVATVETVETMPQKTDDKKPEMLNILTCDIAHFLAVIEDISTDESKAFETEKKAVDDAKKLIKDGNEGTQKIRYYAMKGTPMVERLNAISTILTAHVQKAEYKARNASIILANVDRTKAVSKYVVKFDHVDTKDTKSYITGVSIEKREHSAPFSILSYASARGLDLGSQITATASAIVRYKREKDDAFDASTPASVGDIKRALQDLYTAIELPSEIVPRINGKTAAILAEHIYSDVSNYKQKANLKKAFTAIDEVLWANVNGKTEITY